MCGLFGMSIGFVRNFAGLLALRLLLGIFAGGTLPGMASPFRSYSMLLHSNFAILRRCCTLVRCIRDISFRNGNAFYCSLSYIILHSFGSTGLIFGTSCFINAVVGVYIQLHHPSPHSPTAMRCRSSDTSHHQDGRHRWIGRMEMGLRPRGARHYRICTSRCHAPPRGHQHSKLLDCGREEADMYARTDLSGMICFSCIPQWPQSTQSTKMAKYLVVISPAQMLTRRRWVSNTLASTDTNEMRSLNGTKYEEVRTVALPPCSRA